MDATITVHVWAYVLFWLGGALFGLAIGSVLWRAPDPGSPLDRWRKRRAAARLSGR